MRGSAAAGRESEGNATAKLDGNYFQNGNSFHLGAKMC
jgi:hypothetical protein